MGAFINNTITKAGELAIAKALAGQQLKFTKIVMGDGFLSEGQAIADIEAVINQRVTVDITKRVVMDSTNVAIGGVFSNDDLDEGMYWRELALFAEDPDVGEILYSYGNAGNLAEWIPAGGGQTLVEKSIDIITYVGNAANVSIYLAADAYATREEYERYAQDVLSAKARAEEAYNLAKDALAKSNQVIVLVNNFTNDFTDYKSMLQTLWDAVFSEITSNPWRLTFADLKDITMTSGVWNKDRARLEC